METTAVPEAAPSRVPGVWQALIWAWQRGDDGGGISRWRLLWRSLVAMSKAPRALRRWMTVAYELNSRGLVADLPGEYLRAVRPYVHRHTGYDERVVQLVDHVDWMEQAFKPGPLEDLLACKDLVLAELQPPRGYDIMRLQLRRAPVASPEGELLLLLVLQRSSDVQARPGLMEAAALGFSVFRIDGTPCLAIGGVRGPRHPVLRVSAVELMQALGGWKPSVLLVRVARELARYWHLQIVGLNPSSHQLQGWSYQWQRRNRETLQRIYDSYGALWDHFRASAGPPGWLILPRDNEEKLAATALSPEKRERQIRRADFWLRTVRRLHSEGEQLLQQPGRQTSLTRITKSVQPSAWDGWGGVVGGTAAAGAVVLADEVPVPSRELETGMGALE